MITSREGLSGARRVVVALVATLLVSLAGLVVAPAASAHDPADRTENRPTSFPGIAAPLNAWYQTPPGADPSGVDSSAPAAQIDVDNIEDALEELEEEEAAAETGVEGDASDDAAHQLRLRC